MSHRVHPSFVANTKCVISNLFVVCLPPLNQRIRSYNFLSYQSQLWDVHLGTITPIRPTYSVVQGDSSSLANKFRKSLPSCVQNCSVCDLKPTQLFRLASCIKLFSPSPSKPSLSSSLRESLLKLRACVFQNYNGPLLLGSSMPLFKPRSSADPLLDVFNSPHPSLAGGLGEQNSAKFEPEPDISFAFELPFLDTFASYALLQRGCSPSLPEGRLFIPPADRILFL